MIRIQAPNMTHTIMAFAHCSVHYFLDWKFSLHLLIISFRLKQFTKDFTKTFIRKMRAEILFKGLWSVELVSDMITANEKYWAEWTAAKIFIMQITKSCCRAVPDDRFGVQNDPTCTSVGFSLSSLSRKEGIWRKGPTKVLCSHLALLAADISRCWASYWAEQPQLSMGGSFPRYRARIKGRCIGRKPESIFESGAWTYISCNLRSTNFVFRRVIYRRERRADTRRSESKFFSHFHFSTVVTKKGSWTTSLIGASGFLDRWSLDAVCIHCTVSTCGQTQPTQLLKEIGRAVGYVQNSDISSGARAWKEILAAVNPQINEKNTNSSSILPMNSSLVWVVSAAKSLQIHL